MKFRESECGITTFAGIPQEENEISPAEANENTLFQTVARIDGSVS